MNNRSVSHGRVMLIASILCFVPVLLKITGEAKTVGIILMISGAILGIAGILKVGRTIGMSNILIFMYSLIMIGSMFIFFLPQIHGIIRATQFLKTHEDENVADINDSPAEKIHPNANDLTTPLNTHNQRSADINNSTSDFIEGSDRPQINKPMNEIKADLGKAMPMVKMIFSEVTDNNVQVDLNIDNLDIDHDLSNEQLQKSTPVINIIGGYFGVNYVYETDDAFVYISQADLEQAKISINELHDIAVKNLADFIDNGRSINFSGSETTQMLTIGGNFESALAVIDPLWDSAMYQKFTKGYYVAFAAKDLVFVADGSDEALNSLCNTLISIESDGDVEMLSTRQIFHRDNNRWSAFTFNIK